MAKEEKRYFAGKIVGSEATYIISPEEEPLLIEQALADILNRLDRLEKLADILNRLDRLEKALS